MIPSCYGFYVTNIEVCALGVQLYSEILLRLLLGLTMVHTMEFMNNHAIYMEISLSRQYYEKVARSFLLDRHKLSIQY